MQYYASHPPSKGLYSSNTVYRPFLICTSLFYHVFIFFSFLFVHCQLLVGTYLQNLYEDKSLGKRALNYQDMLHKCKALCTADFGKSWKHLFLNYLILEQLSKKILLFSKNFNVKYGSSFSLWGKCSQFCYLSYFFQNKKTLKVLGSHSPFTFPPYSFLLFLLSQTFSDLFPIILKTMYLSIKPLWISPPASDFNCEGASCQYV